MSSADRSFNQHGATPGLEAEGISKFFSGVPAISRVSIAIRPGEIVGLVGHNGAGKSTLLKVLSGVYRADEGTVRIDGQPVDLHSPGHAIASGISTVHQELSLLTNLSAAENTFLARERTAYGFLQHASMRREAQALIDDFGLKIDANTPIGQYSVATRQLLEIAIAAHRNARFLLLDEPTSSLEGGQIDFFLSTIRSLAREQGVGILIINHKLDEVYAVADHIVALVDGVVRINAQAASVARDDVVRAVAGEEALSLSQQPTQEQAAAGTLEIAAKAPAHVTRKSREAAEGSGEVALKITHLKTATLMDINLTAYAGKVLGIYGLVGSGRTEFLHALIGLDEVLSGTIELFGAPYRPRNPAHARRSGIAYLTEERKRNGIVPQMDSVMNIALPVLDNFRRYGFLDYRALRKTSSDYLGTLRVRGDTSQPIVRLSGGNQQKVLIARALAQEPRVLLLDEPTKGVDLSVKADIHRMVRDLAHKEGLTVVLVSSEEEEILEVADDVAVFVGGVCDGETVPASAMNTTLLRRKAWVTA